MRQGRFKSIILSFILILLYTSVSFAGVTGTIKGYVRDKKTKEGLPSATVIIVGTKMGAITDVNGYFQILNVPANKYTLLAKYVGYADMKIENVEVKPDLTKEVIFDLVVSTAGGTEITVKGKKDLVKVDVTTSIQSNDTQKIENMAVTTITDVINKGAGVVDGHFRGSRDDEVAYNLDGGSINDPVTGAKAVKVGTSTLQAVDVITGAYDAEYGGALGAVVNAITREGGDKLNINLAATYNGFGKDKFDKDFNYRSFVANIGGPLFREDIRFFIGYEGELTPSLVPDLSGKKFSTGTANSDVPYYNPGTPGTYPVKYLFFDQLFQDQPDVVWSHIYPGSRISYEDSLFAKKLTQMASGDYLIIGSDTLCNTALKKAKMVTRFTDLYRKYVLNADKYLDNYYHTVSGKVNFDISSKFRFYLSASFDKQLDILYRQDPLYITSEEDRTNFKFLPWNYLRKETTVYRGSIGGSYVFNPSTFIDFNLSAINMDSKRGAYDYDTKQWREPGVKTSSGVVGSTYIEYASGGYTDAERDFFKYFWRGGNWSYWEKRKNKVVNGNINLTWVPNKINAIKTGIQFKSTTVDQYSISNVGGKMEDNNREETKYKLSPYEIGYYLQNTITFEGMILKPGLRIDMVNSGAKKYKDPYVPDLGQEDVGTKITFSPRFAISHPITDVSKMYFNYAYIYQMPTYLLLYTAYGKPVDKINGGTFGNPDLDPKKTVIYELGYDQQIGEAQVVKIKAFYKELSKLEAARSQFIRLLAGSTGRIQTYYNLDYGSVRGIELNYDGSYSDFWDYWGNLTLQWATGTASGPNDNRNKNEFKIDRKEVYFDYDRRLIINGGITFRVPEDIELSWLPQKWMKDWMFNVGFTYATGTPYTKEFLKQLDRNYYLDKVGETNGARIDDKFKVDLKFNKNFKIWKLKTSFFVEVENLFDKEFVQDVYSTTGKPDCADILPYDYPNLDTVDENYWKKWGGTPGTSNVLDVTSDRHTGLNWYSPSLNADQKAARKYTWQQFIKYRNERMACPDYVEEGREIRVGIKLSY